MARLGGNPKNRLILQERYIARQSNKNHRALKCSRIEKIELKQTRHNHRTYSAETKIRNKIKHRGDYLIWETPTLWTTNKEIITIETITTTSE